MATQPKRRKPLGIIVVYSKDTGRPIRRPIEYFTDSEAQDWVRTVAECGNRAEVQPYKVGRKTRTDR